MDLHVGIPAFEGQQELLIRDLRTGELITLRLVNEGLNRGGGFVEYHFNDPTTEQKENSRKITYVTSFEKSTEALRFIIGAGFFPDDN